MTRTIDFAALKADRPTEVAFEPDAATREAIARQLDIPEVRKLRLVGRLSPVGGRDWRLDATLGATAVQTCVVTLEPVTTRIDEPVVRLFVAGLEPPEGGVETEMPEDDTVEALPARLDLADVAAEALALALPQFPRAEGAALSQAQFTEPGKAPMTDEDAKPFAGLKALRERLDRKP